MSKSIHKTIHISFIKHNNRLLLLAPIELFLQSYQNIIDDNVFVFHDPLTENIAKVGHVNHEKDRETQHLLYDYRKLRKIILDNTEWRFNRRHAIQLNVVITNYLKNFKHYMKPNDAKQLEFLNRKLDI